MDSVAGVAATPHIVGGPEPVTANSRWLQNWSKQLTELKTSTLGGPLLEQRHPWGLQVM